MHIQSVISLIFNIFMDMSLPNIWPIFNFINLVNLKESRSNIKNKQTEDTKTTWYSELIIRHLRLSTYLIVAYFAYTFTFPSYNQLTNITFPWKYWITIIIIRDQCIVLSFYSLWHYILYNSKWSKKIKHLKYNKEYPPQSQWNRDIIWSIIAILITSINEILIIILIRKYPFIIYKSFWEYPFYSLFWLLIIPYWIDLHFYWTHRSQHPWKWKLFGIIDIGKICYSYSHYWHHIDVNIGPWSGLSSNPFDNLLNFGSYFFPICLCIFPQHVYHLFFNKFFAIISILPNHDGFDSPGGASYYHYLHHAHFECNYGSPMVPFDTWFGTYEDGGKYQKKGKDK
eukprot:291957_1